MDEWLDCGNKDATVFTNARILDIKQRSEQLIHSSAAIENSQIIAPCYLGENVTIKNSVIGPFVSIEAGTVVEDSRISNTIVQRNSIVKNARLDNSLLGKNVTYTDKPKDLSLGDFSTQL